MDIFSIIGVLLIAGIVAYIITQIPMPVVFRNVIVALICLALVIYVLGIFKVALPGLR